MELEKINMYDEAFNINVSLQNVTIKRKLASGQTLKLSWVIKNGYPRMIVNFDDKPFTPGENTNRSDFSNIVVYPLDFIRLDAFIELFRNVLKERSERQLELSINYPQVKDGISVTNFIGKIIFGYNNQSGPYIGCSKGDEKPILFPFIPNSEYVTFAMNGERIDPRVELALSYIRVLQKSLEEIYRKTFYYSKTPKPTQQGNYGNSYSNANTTNTQPQTQQPVQQTTEVQGQATPSTQPDNIGDEVVL